MNSCPDSVGLHLLGVTFKTPLARPLLKVQGSWIWWWHLLFILCLTIILLLSLMLDFCYPYLRDLLLIFTLISYFSLWMSIRIRQLVISLSFLRLSRGLFTTFFVSYLESPYFTVMCATDVANVRQSEAQLWPKRPRTEKSTPPASSVPTSSAPPSTSAGGVTLEGVMAQRKRMDARLETFTTKLY